jgi:mevalonate kinase
MAGDDPDERYLVDEAYNAELAAQGSGSPMDASACVHGGGIGVNLPGNEDRKLWCISRGGRSWCVTDMDVPDMTFVVGNTGIKAPTAPQVDKVRRFTRRSNFAAEMIEEIGNVTLCGYEAIRKNDVEALGRMMLTDHKLLSILGVSCKELNKLVNAAMPHSYGAKLTGSGGGGCMIALTDEPDKVAAAIESRGGTAYTMKAGEQGARLESEEPVSPLLDLSSYV